MISGSEYYFVAKRSPLLIMRVAARRGYEYPLKTERGQLCGSRGRFFHFGD